MKKSFLLVFLIPSISFADVSITNPRTTVLPLPSGDANYIQNTNSLQSGTTFYVSSGTVNGQLTVGTTAEMNYGNIQMDIERTPDSSAITATDSGSAGNLNGSYLYRVVFVTANGNTGSSWNQTSNLVAVTNHSVNLTTIPTGTNNVLSRDIYRTDALNSSISPFLMWYVGTINDNTTTTFADNVADSVLTTSATIPVRNTTGDGIFLHDSSGENNRNFEADDQGTYLGHWSGKTSRGYSNTFIGNDTGLQNTTGYWNVCVGHETCENNTGGNSNTFVGLKSGYLETVGINNTGIGEDSLNQGTTIQSDVGVGYHAGFQYNGTQSVFVGANAGQSVTGGQGNVLIGTSASGGGTANPNFSVVIGNTAGTSLQSGNNVIIGNTAGGAVTTGATNVLIGANSGGHLITGANNTMVGHDSGLNSTGSGNIYLGYFGAWQQTSENNILMIDNQASGTEASRQANAIIYSTMSATWQNQSMNINTGNLTTPGNLIVGYNVSGGSVTATSSGSGSTTNSLFLSNPNTGTNTGSRINFNFSTTPTAFQAWMEAVRSNSPTSGGTYMDWATHNGTAVGERMRLSEAGNLGLNTTAPQTLLHMSSGTLTIDGNTAFLNIQGGGNNAYIFQASTTTTWVDVAISSNGHVVTNGPTPTVSSCGTTPNGSVVGDDNQGTITVGGGSVTSCTLTFANAWGKNPVCNITDNSTAVTGDISSISQSSLTVGFSLSLGGGTLWYRCSCSGSGCQ